jgi:hypothetical protein
MPSQLRNIRYPGSWLKNVDAFDSLYIRRLPNNLLERTGDVAGSAGESGYRTP